MMRVKATYDGEVLRLSEPLDLPPGTEVLVTIDRPPPEKTGERGCFFRTARSLNLQGGPPNWSERIGKPMSFIDTALSLNGEGPSDRSQRIDDHLYGGLDDDEAGDTPPTG
jgi:hypothetical protein